jgi:hypothetical protein
MFSFCARPLPLREVDLQPNVKNASIRHSTIGNLKFAHGLTQETTEGKNRQTQASQAHESEPSQETSALQIVSAGFLTR